MGNPNRDYERYGDDYRDREAYGGSTQRRFGSSASDRGEEYFGGSRVGYGQGYSGGARNYGTYPRSYENGPSHERSRYNQAYESDYDDSSTQGFGSEASRRHSGVGYSG